MMLSRRIPKPMFRLARMPWSSGPRCAMARHMRSTTSRSIRSLGSELTIPAMPHMTLSLHRHSGRLRSRNGRAGPSQTVSVIAKLAGVTLAPVAGRDNDVDHLASGDEMQDFAAIGRTRNQLLEKALHGLPQHGIHVIGIHSMRVQLDEHPLRTALDGNRRLFP